MQTFTCRLREEVSVSEGTATFKLFQVATDGSAVAYEGDATSGGGNGEAGQGIGSQFLAKHLADGGWVTNSIQPAGSLARSIRGFRVICRLGCFSLVHQLNPKTIRYQKKLLVVVTTCSMRVLTSENVYRPLFTKAVIPSRPAGEGGFGANVDQLGTDQGYEAVFAGGAVGFNDLFFEVNDALLSGGGVLESELENDVKSRNRQRRKRELLV